MPTSRPAAVLVPVFRAAADTLSLVLIRRTRHGLHGGQIALPGGRPEAGDDSLLATALRETREEIGLAPERVRVLATLPQVHTRSSRYRIQPFLARVEPPDSWRPCPDEVESVLTLSLAALSGPGVDRVARVRTPGFDGTLEVDALQPAPDIIIWGATYRILRPLLEPLQAGRWAI